MDTEILQVRDVPSAHVEVLRQRAAAQGQSLSSYLRELIRDETSRPMMDEALARIESRARVMVPGEEIRLLIEEGRVG